MIINEPKATGEAYQVKVNLQEAGTVDAPMPGGKYEGETLEVATCKGFIV